VYQERAIRQLKERRCVVRSAVDEDDRLPDYAPLLPHVKARAWAVDPQKGYLVMELKRGVFMITDGGYQALFAATAEGVLFFDAPPSFARHIV
jgi:hypothetical protein